MAAFEEFGVMPELIKAVEEMDWLLPTPVQVESIPLALTGSDVLVSAETGSGKTGAYCLPIIQIAYETKKNRDKEPSAEGGQSTTKELQPVKISMVDREGNFSVADEGFLCQSRAENEWQGARATVGVFKGCYYFEIYVRDEGLCRVGWSTKTAKLALGMDKEGFGFGSTGKKSNRGKFDDYGTSFGLNDVIGCLIDRTRGEISFSKNGEHFGTAFQIPKDLQNKSLFPAVTLKNSEVEFNFGSTPLEFLPKDATPLHNITLQDSLEPAPLSNSKSPKDKKAEPVALIVTASRDLVDQICEEIEKMKKYLPPPQITQHAFSTGAAKKQLEVLKQEGVDIVVGTVSRILDLIESRHIDPSSVRFLVLDEADKLVLNGQTDTIIKLYNSLSPLRNDTNQKKLQVMLFSATLHNGPVKKLIESITKFPIWVDLKGGGVVPEAVHHTLVAIDPKTEDLKKLIELEKQGAVMSDDGIHKGDDFNIAGYVYSRDSKIAKGIVLVKLIENQKIHRAIIFCRTKSDCDSLKTYLEIRLKNFENKKEKLCAILHADRPAEERKEGLEGFKAEKINFLICTDLAARGIDVNALPFVINYTLPDKVEDYIHRSGRVGRGDRMGLAISLVSAVKEKVWFHICQSRGKNCQNNRLHEEQGCATWLDEVHLLQAIENAIGTNLDPLDQDYQVVGGTEEVEGKVVYGAKRQKIVKTIYQSHAQELAPSRNELSIMENRVLDAYFHLKMFEWKK